MSERIPPPIMKTTCVWHSRCLVLLAAACIHPTLHAQWTQSSVVSATVSSYDLTLDNGTTTVAYESAGNIYVASKGYLAAEWSSPQLVGAGAKPSVVMAAGGPVVAYMSGSNVMVSSRAGSNWDTVNLGAVNGSIRAMLRMDGAGTLYLLTEGSGTSGRGSLDIATNSGGGWGAFTNLYYGWYDSGSGAYYHQGVLATAPDAAGYRLAYERDSWGGQVSYSTKYLTTGGFPSNPSPGYGWNTVGTIAPGGLAYTSSTGVFGYTIGGTGYLTVFDGASWSAASSLGAVGKVAVSADGGVYAVYDQGGILRQFDGSTSTDLLYESATVSGNSPLLYGSSDANGVSHHLLFTDGSSQLVYMTTAVPEPGAWAALAGVAVLVFTWFRRSRCMRSS